MGKMKKRNVALVAKCKQVKKKPERKKGTGSQME